MELNLQQFEELLEHYNMTLEKVLEAYTTALESADQNFIKGKQIYISVVPAMTYPPMGQVAVYLEGDLAIYAKVGYFDLTRHLKQNMH